ncbi:sugar kinase [Actinoplanes sp. NPDC026619]|uniref:sugar kinase n=1 Tax=Actinoplanes sp. NPDC026619 TaxID=3155798 RepID=UPI0033D4F481
MVAAFDAICVGESMAQLTPHPAGPLSAGGPMWLDVAGAESNVAVHLARLGDRVAWASRVGADPLGRLVRDRIAGYGVDMSLAETDPARPTGVYFKDPGGGTTTVHYYRAGSAAATLGPSLLAHPAFAACRLIHLSGITPALSESCLALIDRALAMPTTVSFDVNHRPALWPSVRRAAAVLAGLADRAGLVFVGLDEADRLWGTGTPAEVRERLAGPAVLVVKDGARGATSFHPGGVTFVPAGPVEVVEPVGAGDAFAGGYLHGLLAGWAEPARLALGHRIAAAALRTGGDIGEDLGEDS